MTEFNTHSSLDDHPAAFVRDWRIRKISPTKVIQPDGAPIVRRRTVITIGSVGELKDNSYGLEEHSISASEVGETACGRISITVKTIPTTGLSRTNSINNSSYTDVEEEWPTRDVVPLKPSLVTDPARICSTKQHGRLLPKIWQNQRQSRDITSIGMVNQDSIYSVTEIDVAQPIIPETTPEIVSNFELLETPSTTSFKTLSGSQWKKIHLSDQGGPKRSSTGFGKSQQIQPDEKTTNFASPTRIRYQEWIKSLDRPDSPTVNPIQLSKEMKPVVNASLSGNDQHYIPLIKTVQSPSSPPKSILKNGRKDSCSSQSIRSDSSEILQSSLDDQSNQNQWAFNRTSLKSEDKDNTIVRDEPFFPCDPQKPKSFTEEKNSFSSAEQTGADKAVVTKSHEIIPTINNKLLTSENTKDYRKNVFNQDGSDSNVQVTSQNQINSLRSKKTSDCKNSNEPSLSSGMAIDKATELVRQYFNGPSLDADDKNPSLFPMIDKKTLSLSESNLLLEDVSHLHDNHSGKHQTSLTSVGKNQEVTSQQIRGRTPIKSKIPLRIPRSSAVYSPHHNTVATTTPSDVSIKAKPIVQNKVKTYHSAGRTRSVDSSRQLVPLLSSSVYTNPRSEMTNDKSFGYKKTNSFQPVSYHY